MGASEPVAFFAYPNKPSLLAPPDCRIHHLATPHEDGVRALADLADELDAPADIDNRMERRPRLAHGRISAWKRSGLRSPC
ncbi:MAG: hypothetical protein R2856_26760 [Caldilineaceae bacterium]